MEGGGSVSRLENTIFIDRPIEDVWAFLVDTSHLSEWCPEVEEVMRPSREPLRRGTSIAVSVRIGPLRMTTHQEVTELEEHRTIELRWVAGALGGSLVARADLQPAHGLTRLTQTASVGGLLGMLGALGPDRRTRRGAFFAALKWRLEETEARSEPARAEALDSETIAEPIAAEPSAVEPTAAETIVTEPLAVEPTPAELTVAELAAAEPTHVTESTVGAASTVATESIVVEDPTGAADDEAGTRPAAVRETTPAEAARPTPPHDQPVETPAREPSPRTAADSAGRRTRRDRPVDVGPLVLRFETESGPAPTFEVTRSGATIGRAPENTIRLDDLSVSRRHARISFRQGGYWLNDLKSTSGTWVDGTKLNAPHRLADGQVVGIGILRLKALLPGAHEETSEAGEDAPRPEELAGQERSQR